MRFYTNAPIPYPYLLDHMRNRKRIIARAFEHGIVDSGVVIFMKRSVTDYPSSYLKTYGFYARRISQIKPVWVTIPDYPDDYNVGQFGDNVAKTVGNIERFLSVDGVEWLPVLQAPFLNKIKFFEGIQATRKAVGNYPRLGIGTVCKCENLDYIEYCCQATRKFFPKTHLHAFGLTLKALPKVKDVIDSFDSMAWTKPRVSGQSSCRNKKERIEFFEAYLKRIDDILS